MSEIREEAETSVLGAVFLHAECFPRVNQIIEPFMFFNPAWREVFATMRAMWEANVPIDQLTLAKALKDRGKMQDVGGASAFAGFSGDVAAVYNVETYARMVREFYYQRRMVLTASDIAARGKQPLDDVGAYLSESSRKIIAATKGFAGVEPVPDMKKATWDTYEESIDPREPPGMFRTGLSDFDYFYRGLPPEYVIIGAFPGTGKTTFMINLISNNAVNLAQKGEKRIAFFSMEDSRTLVIQAMLSRYSGVDLSKITQHKVTHEEAQKIATAANIVREMPVFIDDRAGYDIGRIRDICMELHEEKPLAAVFIDHLGKIRERGKDRYHVITSASSGIADLQRQLRIPVVCAHQLNRKKESGDTSAPSISSLRDSGMVEADARVILMLHRPHYYFETGVTKMEPDANEFCIGVVKFRSSKPRRVQMWCDMSTAYIGDKPTMDSQGEVYGGNDGY